MYVRLTFCKFSPESIDEVRKIYLRDIVPVVRKQKGNLGIRMMEPVDPNEDFISFTEWNSKADADDYEYSGLYKKLVSKIAPYLVQEPVLQSYNAVDVMETVF